MGTVVGVALQRAGHDVVFLGRALGESNGPLLEEIEYVSLEGTADCIHIRAVRDPSVVANADLVIVLVKAPDTIDAMVRIAPFLAMETPIVTLQNGLRAADRIRAKLGSDHCVIAGATSQAAMRTDPHTFVHTAEGPTRIGFDDPRSRRAATWIAALFTAAGIPTAVVESIEGEIWQKVAINAAINGPTALCGTENGAIVDEPELCRLAIEVASEAVQVAEEHGFLLPDIENVVIDTASASSTNRSSMLQDIATGRPTEADAIYGEIQRAARVNGIATPRIDALSALVHGRSRASSKERLIEYDA